MSGRLFLSAAALLFLIILTVRGERKGAEPARYFRLNLIAGLAGAGVLLLSLLALLIGLRTGKADADFRAWFRDLFGGYLTGSAVLSAVVALLLLASIPLTKADPRQRTGARRLLRSALSLAASASLLLLACLPPLFVPQDRLLLSVSLYFSGFGWAFLLRLPLLPDYSMRGGGSEGNRS